MHAQLQQRIRVKAVSSAADSAALAAQLDAASSAHGTAVEAQSQAHAEVQVPPSRDPTQRFRPRQQAAAFMLAVVAGRAWSGSSTS